MVGKITSSPFPSPDPGLVLEALVALCLLLGLVLAVLGSVLSLVCTAAVAKVVEALVALGLLLGLVLGPVLGLVCTAEVVLVGVGLRGEYLAKILAKTSWHF